MKRARPIMWLMTGRETRSTEQETDMSGLGSFIPHPIYDDYRKIYVWQKGLLIPGQDPTLWRYDDYYMVIKWSDYGDRSSVYGWEIDHCIPSSFGGADDISNLRPLNWFNNARYGGALSNLPNKGFGSIS